MGWVFPSISGAIAWRSEAYYRIGDEIPIRHSYFLTIRYLVFPSNIERPENSDIAINRFRKFILYNDPEFIEEVELKTQQVIDMVEKLAHGRSSKTGYGKIDPLFGTLLINRGSYRYGCVIWRFIYRGLYTIIRKEDKTIRKKRGARSHALGKTLA